MHDTWEGHKSQCALSQLFLGTQKKNLQDIYITFHDIPWGTGSVNDVNFLPV